MTERPIIYSGGMVRAILDGRKTQTRRVVKLPDDVTEGPRYWTTPSGRSQAGYADPGVNYWTPQGNHINPCPYGQPGDRLWVREAARIDYLGENFKSPEKSAWSITYRADDRHIMHRGLLPGRWFPNISHKVNGSMRWASPIHMPKWAARIWLEVTRVRVERLQEISEADAMAEGVKPLTIADGGFVLLSGHDYIGAFCNLWNAINAKRGHGWDTNPWVWVIEFERISAENRSASVPQDDQVSENGR